MQKTILLSVWLTFLSLSHFTSAQTLNTQGANITITANTTLIITGDMENADNGTIDNQGTIQVTGNWTNNATNTVFVNNGGTVNLNGDNQNINGNSTAFGTLDLANGTGYVTLQTNTTITENLHLNTRDLNLNAQQLTIENPSNTAITSTGGSIISESEASQVHWNTDTNTGSYPIPFGAVDGTPIPLTIDITTAGTGGITAATYSTADDNTPLPTGIAELTLNGNEIAQETLDRFWLLEINGATTNITFTYAPDDLTGNTITEADLKALNHNGTHWQDTNSGSFDGVGSNSFTGLVAVSGAFTLTAADGGTPTVTAQIKLFLEAPYDINTNSMTNDLRMADLLPIQQPFGRTPWEYFGIEQFNSLQDIPADAVDWVFVELRDKTNNNVVVAEKAAILLQDGTVQDVNGTNGVVFFIPTGDYFISVKTRHHLATLSSNASTLPNVVVYDFSDASQVEGGIDQCVEVETGIFAQAGGDFDSDGVITVSDFNLYNTQASLLNVYVDSDVNADKSVTVADFNFYQQNSSRIGVTQIRY